MGSTVGVGRVNYSFYVLATILELYIIDIYRRICGNVYHTSLCVFSRAAVFFLMFIYSCVEA